MVFLPLNIRHLRQKKYAFIEESNDNQTITSIYDTELCQLNRAQLNFFIAILAILCLLSLVGNVSTLFVNFKRKLRPFFRTCLISLAFSDLASSVFLTTVYMAQFSSEYLQKWNLGSFMCKLVPYAFTTAILTNSMTLVAIAIDRYFVLIKMIIGRWNPGKTFCVVCMFGIWAASIAISSPLLYIYAQKWVYILNAQAEQSSAQPKDQIPMCIPNDKNIVLYYIILLVLIFLPCILGFLWLNTIIVRKMWKRRHNTTAMPNGNPTPSNGQQHGKAPTTHTQSQTAREARYMRMFIVIVIMIAMFIFQRLPAWIFLIVRMYGSYLRPLHWILYFCFSILNIISCVLNPLFYTFLAQTIHYFTKMKHNIGKFLCCNSLKKNKCPIYCICCDLLYSWLHCYKLNEFEPRISIVELAHTENVPPREPECQQETDEGVDCGDDKDSMKDFYIYSQRIYTIFPSLLVSSSVSAK